MQLKHGLDQDLPQALMQRYVYDFTCMHAYPVASLDKEKQAHVVWKLLTLAHQQAPQRLAAVHSTFWQIEATIRSYFLLVEAVPSACDVLVHYILSEETQTSGAKMDIDVIRIVLNAREARLAQRRGLRGLDGQVQPGTFHDRAAVAQ